MKKNYPQKQNNTAKASRFILFIALYSFLLNPNTTKAQRIGDPCCMSGQTGTWVNGYSPAGCTPVDSSNYLFILILPPEWVGNMANGKQYPFVFGKLNYEYVFFYNIVAFGGPQLGGIYPILGIDPVTHYQREFGFGYEIYPRVAHTAYIDKYCVVLDTPGEATRQPSNGVQISTYLSHNANASPSSICQGSSFSSTLTDVHPGIYQLKDMATGTLLSAPVTVTATAASLTLTSYPITASLFANGVLPTSLQNFAAYNGSSYDAAPSARRVYTNPDFPDNRFNFDNPQYYDVAVNLVKPISITPNTDNVTTVAACGSYTWNGTTYTTSGIKTGTTTNCVTEKLNLTITPSTENVTNAVGTNSYTWANNNQIYATSGIYNGTTTNCFTQKLNLTLTNQASQTALDFDGVNDNAVINNNVGLNPTAFTIATWVKWKRSGTAVDFVCGKGNETMEIHFGGTSNNIRFIPTPGVYLDAGTNSITPDTWVHLAVVYNPAMSLAKMYVNGLEIPLTNNGSNPLSTAVASSTNNFILGSRGNLDYPLKGQLDEFQVWNRALTITEIQAYSLCAVPTSSAGLLVNLHLNNGIANGNNVGINSANDSSTNNNNANLVNFSLTGNESNFVDSTVGISYGSENTTTISACDSYTWNGTTYTSSGIKIGSTTNCVTEKLNLTINESNLNGISITACNSYTWNGTTYTQSGNYFGNTVNCLTDFLVLTIKPNTESVTTRTACDSYTWNGQTYTTSGIKTGTTTNCVTEKLDLTINTTPVISGNATQTFNTSDTIANIVVNPTNVVWYASLANAVEGLTPLLPTEVLVNNATYYAVTTGNCPSSPFAVLVQTTLANTTFDNKLNIGLFPNPSTGIYNLILPIDLQVEVYNNLGQLLWSEKMRSGANVINIANKAAGVYFLKAKDGSNISTFKIIKN